MDKRDLWLNSQVGTHDPDTIEGDVSNLYRTIFKLEKTFGDFPVVHDMVLQVSRISLFPQMEIFKVKVILESIIPF